jgi:hypothetical protein
MEHGRILPVINQVNFDAWQFNTANNGTLLSQDGRLLSQDGRLLPPNKVLRRSLIRS